MNWSSEVRCSLMRPRPIAADGLRRFHNFIIPSSVSVKSFCNEVWKLRIFANMNDRFTENFATHCCLFRLGIPCELRVVIQIFRSFNSTILSHEGSPTTSSNACHQIVKNMTQVMGNTNGVEELHDIGDLLDVLIGIPSPGTTSLGDYTGEQTPTGYPVYQYSASRALEVHRNVLNKTTDTQLDVLLQILPMNWYLFFRSLSPIERIIKYHERYSSKIRMSDFLGAVGNNEFLGREERRKMMADIITGKYKVK